MYFCVVHITDNHAGSLKAGGQGMRYTIRINGRQTYLYYENPNYFVKAKQLGFKKICVAFRVA